MSDAAHRDAIAVVGMAGRFPGADDPDRLWRNLRDGKESVAFFSRPELAAAGVEPDLLQDPAYVPARGVLSDIASWDAAFFGSSPREAEILDPQQRLFLECAWEALEDAGYDSARFPGRIGVYAGATASTYWSHNLRNGSDARDPTGGFQILIANDKDYLSTRVSFMLDLRGPSVGVQTACSTSLVAVHQACQSLLDRECDMALAGGSSIQLPTPMGYLYQPDGIMSPDGHNRSFDARGRGSVFGDGVAAVLLKRLGEAIEDGDHVHAVILGSAVNNDGAAKVGFTAPSVDAQAAVVAEALAVAGVAPGTITYLEAHGSATPLGDPIEVSALTRAFRGGTDRRGYCALGSVKSNLGHLYTASGVTALIKTIQALRHRQVPPSLHFEVPNPDIDFAASPFFVARELREWRTEPGVPRRAAVNSLGIGGTNAHAILEEAPPAAPSGPARPWQLLPLSARSAGALAAASANLVHHLRGDAEASFADVAWTLQAGRRAFAHRRAVFARGAAEAAAALETLDPARVATNLREPGARPVALLFGGVGDQYPGMGLGLYRSEPTFRAVVDRCAELLAPRLGLDIRDVLYPERQERSAAMPPAAVAGAAGGAPDLRRLLRRGGEAAAGAPGRGRLDDTAVAQPALFVLQYALASLWREWGIRPRALIGHSLGEYVAASVAGVLPLEDALTLVAERARLIAALPGGAMLTLPLPEAEARLLLRGHLSLAAVNGPASTVVSGPAEEIAALELELRGRGVPSSRPGATHAFHSPLLAPAALPLTRLAAALRLQPPTIPYLSNLTGGWITAAEAADPGYWAQHMVHTVRFAAGLAELLADPDLVLLEVGPGQSLGSFVRQHPRCSRDQAVLPTLRHAAVLEADERFLVRTVGKLWLAGVELDWAGYHRHERRRRVRLPTYPFERRRYWLDRSREAPPAPAAGPPRPRKLPQVADWLYRPEWRERPLPAAGGGQAGAAAQGERWLLLAGAVDGAAGPAARRSAPAAAALAARLRQAGHRVATVAAGDGFGVLGPGSYCVRPSAGDDWRALLAELRDGNRQPARIVHLWSLTGEDPRPLAERLAEQQELGFYALVALARALDAAGDATPLRLTVVADGLQPVLPGERSDPEKAPLLGLCRVLAQEIAGLSCHAVDVPGALGVADGPQAPPAGEALDALVAMLASGGAADPAADLGPPPLTACRAGRLWEEVYTPVGHDPSGGREQQAAGRSRLRQRGVYLIAGGLGGAGLILAGHLARAAAARLVLVGRTALPPRSEWAAWRRERGAADPVARQLAAVEGLEAFGAEVAVEAADLADGAALRGVVERCVARFGGLHGVVHAAGLPGVAGLVPLREAGHELCAAHFRSKVLGTLALAEALRGHELDFCLLMSSLSTVIGGALLGPYAAANRFLDAFAAQRARHGEPWRAVDWDRWPTGPTPGTAATALASPYEMTADEAIEVFERCLALDGLPRVVVSTGALADRLAESAPRPLAPPGRPLPTATAAGYARPDLRVAYAPPSSELERRIAAAWRQALGLEQVGVDDHFFELGGNSLVGAQLLALLRRDLSLEIPAVTLFEAPTVGALARLLAPRLGAPAAAPPIAGTVRAAALPAPATGGAGSEVAIVGMAGRFPGAGSVAELWRNLCAAHEAVSFFGDEELIAAGADPTEILRPDYVRARPILRGADEFDARLFGYSPRDAALLDPQLRVFLECAWEALEDAGYDPQQTAAPIGLFAGASFSTYLLRLYSDPELAATLDPFQMMVGNDKDSVPTTASYKLDLKGPSVAVQTHCSTSLVAVHLACQSLLAGECSLALAGGVSIQAPQKHGYRYQLGGQDSSDGHTRPFDAGATGTVFGDGVAIVVLKPLAAALADGDRLYAVIKGSAVNNDGSLKAGYTAPSVDGQARSVALALARAGVDAATISYVEAHGSATPLGDPIELAALTRAFRAHTPERGFCGLGSVKGNVGHLDRAAGVTGLIKTALALRDGVLPASLHFERPNPELDLASSPFHVVAERAPWPARGGPRRAVVSALGMGGTNAHAIVEEAPPAPPSGPSRPWQLLALSARSPGALATVAAGLAGHLAQRESLAAPAAGAGADDPDHRELADAAFTLHLGRRHLEHRQAILCRSREDALAALAAGDPRQVFTQDRRPAQRRVAFLLPGLGDHYPGMGLGLYRSEPTFRRHLDRCAEILSPLLGADLLELVYPAGLDEQDEPVDPAAATGDLRRLLGRGSRQAGSADTGRASGLERTLYAQPAVFAVEYALARLWMEWGVHPDALLGYSLGEYVAACLAGTLTLEDALRLVAGRARLIEGLPPGAMLAVPLAAEVAATLLGADLALAAVSGPDLAVLAGPLPAIAALEAELAGRGVAARRLATTHAFHSPGMAPICGPFRELLASVELSPPHLPYVSNVTGRWITAEEATDREHWVRHLLGTVRFGDGLGLLLADPERILLEVGPGQTLGSFAKQHPACDGERGRFVFGSLRGGFERRPDQALLLATLGRLWVAGARVDWGGFHAHERRRRVALPTYPFERQRHWLEPRRPAAGVPAAGARRGLAKQPDLADWFYLSGWRQAAPATAGSEPDDAGGGADAGAPWLLLLDGGGLGELLAARLAAVGRTVVRAVAGGELERLGDGVWALDPLRRDQVASLLVALRAAGGPPSRIVHLGAADPRPPAGPEEALDLGFYSLLALVQALPQSGAGRCRIDVVTSRAHQVMGDEELVPERCAVLGPVKVVPQELPHLAIRQIDLAPGERWDEATVARLAGELAAASPPVVALRGCHRWVPSFDRMRVAAAAGSSPPWRERGVYLITGGLGGIGLGLARYLAAAWQARLVLVGRTPQVSAGGGAGATRAARLRELEELGGEVLVAAADVTDVAAMRDVVRQAVDRFGVIHGALHVAGVPGAGLIELKTREAAARVLAPKVTGARVLDEVLRPLPLDFLVLFSSVAAVLGGGPGQVDYCAANAVLGAMARARQAAGRRTVAIDWSEWQWDAWQEGLLGFAPEIRALLRDNRRRLGITFEEGAEALGRALACGLPQVVVSAADLGALGDFAGSLSRPDALGELHGDGGPHVAHSRPALSSVYVAPRGELESALAAMWRDLLGLEAVGAEDDFFELGGHSLLATQLFARLRDARGVELPLRAIFEAPTVAGLAARITVAGGEAGLAQRAAAPAIERLARQGPLPLSFAQARFWLLDQLEADRAVYNESGIFELSGGLDPAALRRTLTAIVARHETLRTSFPLAGEEPAAVIHEAAAVALPLIDLAGLPPARRQGRAVLVAAEQGRRTFDLGRPPLFTAHLLRLSGSEHWLLVRTHHLIWDGESAQVAAREIAAAYPGCAARQTPSLPALPIQYVDYAAWQRSRLGDEALAARLGYWRERLAGAPPQLELPADRPRPAVRSLRGGARSLPLPPALWAAVRTLAQARGATPFMVLMAAFQLLLARCADVSDVAVGTPVSGRDAAATEGLIGLFINTVVLRETSALAGDFAALLGRARQAVLEAHQHQVPFEGLVAELAPQRGQARQQPFFQALFSLQDPPPVPDFGGLTLRFRDLPVELTKFDLTLIVAQRGGAAAATLEYLADLFDGATVQRWLAQYLQLLAVATAEPARALAGLPLLDAAARWQIAGEWAGEERPRPAGQRLEDELREWARRAPDAVVAVCESHWLSYRELDDRAERWRARLTALGVGPESRVALLLEPGLEALVAVLAVLRAGGAYVPLSLRFPPEQRALLLAEAEARVLLTESRRRPELAGFDGTVLALDEPVRGGSRRPVARPRPGLSDRHAAYLIYTSGSTGQAKAVVVEHRQALSHVQSIRERLPFAPGMRYALIHPLAVDGSKTLLFAVLAGGGCLHVITQERATDGRALADYFATRQIDVLKIAPSHLAALHRTIEPARLMPRRWLMVGGEASRSDWIAELLRLAPACTICNHYGPTETAVGVVTQLLRAGEPPATAPQAPLGRPLANAFVYVLDRRLAPVPIGVPGEIFIGGRSVSRGYLKRPAATAEAFLPDPFGAAPGGRLYRTGDLARWRPDGTLEFLGRTDFQVKVRGFRIELRAIEAQLALHPAVGEAVVTTRPDAAGDACLVAYLVPAPGAEIRPRELRAFLKSRLPEYMVPAVFASLDSLPRQAQGKIDVRALPAPAPPRSGDHGAAPPRTATEEKVAAVWCEVMGLAQVGLEDDFFALGGHSFLAMQLVSRLRQALALDISLRDLFAAPTVGGLAAAAESLRGPQAPPLAAAAGRPADLPLSFQQERYWFIVQLGGTRTLSARGYRLEGDLDLGALARALNAVIARHAALRTLVDAAGKRPLQRVLAAAPLTLRVYDLSRLPARGCKLAHEAWGGQFQRFELPLDRAPLLAAAVLRLDAREHSVVLMAHHAAFDALSWAVLFGELDALYGAFSRGLPAPRLPHLPIDYADYAIWQRQRFHGEALKAEVAFWGGRLAGAPLLLDHLADLPAARPGSRASSYSLRLETRVAAGLMQLGARHAATPFMTLLAVYKALLHCTTGLADISVATYATGRGHLEIEGLIGLFAGLAALRTRLAGAMPFTAALAEVRRVTVEAFSRQQDLPLQKLISELYPAVDLRRLAEAMFSYLPAVGSRFTLSLPGVQVSALTREDLEGAADLSLALRETDDGVRGRFQLAGRILPATGERLARRFELLAAEVASHPESSLAELWAAVAAAESARRDRQLEELQAASRARLRRSPRRNAAGSPA